MIFVVALTYQQAHYYCERVANPPINPRGKDVRIFSTSDYGAERVVRGRYFKADDTLIWYGPWSEGRYAREVFNVINSLIGQTGIEPKEIHV